MEESNRKSKRTKLRLRLIIIIMTIGVSLAVVMLLCYPFQKVSQSNVQQRIPWTIEIIKPEKEIVLRVLSTTFAPDPTPAFIEGLKEIHGKYNITKRVSVAGRDNYTGVTRTVALILVIEPKK